MSLRILVNLLKISIVLDAMDMGQAAPPYFQSNAPLYSNDSAKILRRRTNTDARSISHYIDENGVKVEKDNVDAVVIQSEGISQNSEDPTEEKQYEDWMGSDDYGEEDSYPYTYRATTSATSEMSNTKGSDDEDIYDDDDPTPRKKTQSSSFLDSASNVFNVYTSLLTAWDSVRKHREEMAKNETIMRDKIANQTRLREQMENQTRIREQSHRFQNLTQNVEEDDRLRRNSWNDATEIPMSLSSSTELAVAEGRYIKGDPLKGYYDFVITEGSYKFWAAFQLATAALVIYSTFAAIYYSKVNPIVSDYDYVDYLGGGRSLADSDAAYYQDPSDTSTPSEESKTNATSIWSSMSEWIPKFGHTAKFVLESIDKIPH